MMKKVVTLLVSHGLALGIGFAAGLYYLPVLTAPTAPDNTTVIEQTEKASFAGIFQRYLTGSDALHWGEGKVYITPHKVVFEGKLAPGPDYKLYFSPTFVETEEDFLKAKQSMVRVGDVDTFNNFIVPIPEGIDPSRYKAVIVWCESFGQFITAARYQE